MTPGPCELGVITHFELIEASQDAGMGRVVWSVREGKVGDFGGPELTSGYRSADPIHEPKLGDVLRLPDGSGPWRVVDWVVADRSDAPGNVLVVELFDE